MATVGVWRELIPEKCRLLVTDEALLPLDLEGKYSLIFLDGSIFGLLPDHMTVT